MVIQTVTVTYGRKLNLGDYNNANLEITLGALIEESDNLDQALAQLWQTARESVKGQAQRLLKKNGGE